MSAFTHAIVRPPPRSFAKGLTSATLGIPDVDVAIAQHRAYCDALVRSGLSVTTLEPREDFPDSTFVEDVAVLTERGAIIARPGAKPRRGEAVLARSALARLFPSAAAIESPGSLDGGDVCEADGRFYIGVSRRTNEDGAAQLSGWLSRIGYTSSTIDIRSLGSILHLKSGIAYVGDGTIVAIDELAVHPALQRHRIVRPDAREAYAANCVRVNDRVFVAAGFPRLTASLEELGFRAEPLMMSEFQKMDGGPSCLSLRF